jgi:hypothetical protein
VAVTLNYLLSYEHMGRARLGCGGMCSCTPVEVDAHHVKPADGSGRNSSTYTGIEVVVHLNATSELGRGAGDAEPAGGERRALQPPCTLTAKVQEGTSSGEHRFRMSGLAVRPV